MASTSKTLRRANPATIQDKFLVGYQGWFACAGDGPPIQPGHHGWIHWFDKPLPDGGHPTIDAWPDVSDYPPSELYPAPGLTIDGDKPALLFSSRNPKTVERHFHLMAMHGVDGAFLQRFAVSCEADGRTEGGNAEQMRWRDEVGRSVRAAAEKEGRVFAIMYDVSGVPGDRIEKVIKVDWQHLMRDEHILDSPAYLHEGGKPVVALWGLGFDRRGHTPETVRNIVRFIKSVTPGGAYVMAGAPTHWRILRGDADPDPGFLDVWYNEFDAISPWTVGRYHNEEAADNFLVEKIRKDMAALKERRENGGHKIDYIPVIFPGASGNNLSGGKWKYNDNPRDGGKFLWRQLHNVKKEGVRIIYGAMWDEYDEATAFLPIVQTKRQVPKPGKFLALDEDGYDLPSDWFMRISGFAGELLRGERMLHETFPVKELQDYWSSRPKYEESNHSMGASSSNTASSSAEQPCAGGDVSQTFEDWVEQEKEEKEEAPPPPYTLEALEDEAVPPETTAAPRHDPIVSQGTAGQSLQRVVTPQDRPAPSSSLQEPHALTPIDVMQSRADHVPTPVHAFHSAVDTQPVENAYLPPSRVSSLSQASASRPPHVALLNRPASFQASSSTQRPTHGGVPNSRPSVQHQPHSEPSNLPGTSTVASITDDFGRQNLNEVTESVSNPPPSVHHISPLPPPDSVHGNNHISPVDTSPAPQWPPSEWNTQSSTSSSGGNYINYETHPHNPFHMPSAHSPHPIANYASSVAAEVKTHFPHFHNGSSTAHTMPSMPRPSPSPPGRPGWAFDNSSPGSPAGVASSISIPPPIPGNRPPLPPRVSSVGSATSPTNFYPQPQPESIYQQGPSSYFPHHPQNFHMPFGNPSQPNVTGEANGMGPGGFANPQSYQPNYNPHFTTPPSSQNQTPMTMPSYLPPPAIPPRPLSAMASMPQAPNSSDRLLNVASGAYSMALGAVDRVAGSSTRRQLEKGVDSLTDTGTKLYQRFAK